MQQQPHRTLHGAFNYLLAGSDRIATTRPPAEFKGRVTRLLRSGAYIHISALCEPDIGELESKLCTSGLLSPATFTTAFLATGQAGSDTKARSAAPARGHGNKQ